MSSSQVTNSIIFQRRRSTTKQKCLVNLQWFATTRKRWLCSFCSPKPVSGFIVMIYDVAMQQLSLALFGIISHKFLGKPADRKLCCSQPNDVGFSSICSFQSLDQIEEQLERICAMKTVGTVPFFYAFVNVRSYIAIFPGVLFPMWFLGTSICRVCFQPSRYG